MTISPINNLTYYTNLAKEDYYLDGGEPNGKWAGKGAHLLGLKGDVQPNDYFNVLNGYTPNGKIALCQSPGKQHNHGWDITFSAPKSVSVAWARADQHLKKQIQLAQEKAVRSTVKLLEQEVAITRRGKNGSEREPAIGLIASMFEHATSRAQDPQLHTHCLIANVAPREDGTWGTLESKSFYLWQKALGAAYRAEFANQLKLLGFTLESDGEAFKLADIPQNICDYYSKRSQLINDELVKRGNVKRTSKSGDIAALATREAKADVNRPELYEYWAAELDTLGFKHADLTNIINENWHKPKFHYLTNAENTPPAISNEQIEYCLTEKHSVFKKQDVYRVSCELAQLTGEGLKVASAHAENFLKGTEIIPLGKDHQFNSLYTTKTILQMEGDMIYCAKRLSNSSHFQLSDSSIQKAISEQSVILTDEQLEAVHYVCQPSHFSILQGSAGAGKSTTMHSVSRAYESEGFKVIGAAISKAAADNLSKEASIQTFTVAKLLIDIKKNTFALHNKAVVIVDEAGQMGSRQLKQLLEEAEKHGSKIILVGEDKQLQAIEHAGALKYLSNPDVLGTTRIETIKRQREDWAKQSVANFRDGNALPALKEYQKRDLLNTGKDANETKIKLVNKWKAFRQSTPDKQWLVIAQTWSDVHDLNDRIRNELKTEGIIEDNEVEVACTASNRKFTSKIATGERIKLTKNDYRLGLTNGATGTVTGITKAQNDEFIFDISLDSGRSITISSSEYSDKEDNLHIAQAYASTVYSSQGLTVDGDTFVYYTCAMDRANTYVACSRHKDNSHLFVNAQEVNEFISNLDREKYGDKAFMQTLASKMSLNGKVVLATELSNQLEVNRSPEAEI